MKKLEGKATRSSELQLAMENSVKESLRLGQTLRASKTISRTAVMRSLTGNN